MGKVHRDVEAHGPKAAIAAGYDPSEVRAAHAFMTDENNAIGFLYSGSCQAALPHRRLSDDQGWQITSDNISLVVEPGMRATPSGKPEMVGVPYGSRARLIMLYLQSEAMRTQSREVELGGSLRDWLTRMGIPRGGKSIHDVRDQAERIMRCRITLQLNFGQSSGLMNQSIVDTAIFLDAKETKQGSLFTEKTRLSEGFFNQLQHHSVPLQEAAIRHINNNSIALDQYAWLAYRLHVLEKPILVRWAAVKTQFGSGFAKLSHFKGSFIPNLKLALAVYPDAKVEVTDEGIMLYPSPPPVAAAKVLSRPRPPTHLGSAAVKPTLDLPSREGAIAMAVVAQAMWSIGSYTPPTQPQQVPEPVQENVQVVDRATSVAKRINLSKTAKKITNDATFAMVRKTGKTTDIGTQHAGSLFGPGDIDHDIDQAFRAPEA